MSYQVLARKWRPQNFKQMVGQEHVLRALIHALDSQRLHHAYLFTGTRGVGKTTIGRILAKCLSCDTGITSEPCGSCGACTGIAEGRYVDLIEIDAASRTKVEDMRELLDNVPYSPSEGRFKIYLIDEVHMLSQSSFNALLKTLEEPPEHVKFLFATTDPQKLPVTILSRCLQFNLKNMSPERIVGHLQHILEKEQVSAEEPSLWALARAADGSMRDALSLTDQAIAYGNQALTEADVSAMLGTVDQKRVYRILKAAIGNNAREMLDEVKALAEFSPDYASVMANLISILHRVAVEQAVPGTADNAMGDQAEIVALATQVCAEDIQLFYQIALAGRKDLEMHPEPRSGLEMSLIRMMAFQLDKPVDAGSEKPLLGSAPAQGEVNTQDQQGSDAGSADKAVNVDADRGQAVEPEPAASDKSHTEGAAVSAPVAENVIKDSGAGRPVAEDLPQGPAIQDLPPIEAYEARAEDFEPPAMDDAAYHGGSEPRDNASDPDSKKKTELITAADAGEARPASSVASESRAEAATVQGVAMEPVAAGMHSGAPDSARPEADVLFDQSAANSLERSLDISPELSGEQSPEPSPGLSAQQHTQDEDERPDSWPKQAAQVAVTGMTQNLLFNMALEEAGDKLTLYVESGHYRLLSDGHQKRIIAAMKQYYGSHKTLVLVDGLKEGQETPMMWRERRHSEMLALARSAVHADPNVQELVNVFDAVLIDESIKALGSL